MTGQSPPPKKVLPGKSGDVACGLSAAGIVLWLMTTADGDDPSRVSESTIMLVVVALGLVVAGGLLGANAWSKREPGWGGTACLISVGFIAFLIYRIFATG